MSISLTEKLPHTWPDRPALIILKILRRFDPRDFRLSAGIGRAGLPILGPGYGLQPG